jgi:hypothetical protein
MRWVFASLLLIAGCSTPSGSFGNSDQSIAPGDAAATVRDAGGPDLAGAPDLAAVPDQATLLDLAAPPDLSSACTGDPQCSLPHATARCSNGTCVVAGCNQGFSDCDNRPENGCEVNLGSDPLNCGGCARSCPNLANATVACINGSCAIGSCNTGFADCNNMPNDGCEVNTAGDARNCGACGKLCGPYPNGTAVCQAGACVNACNAGFADCDMNPANGCETDTRVDVKSCGACGAACALANATPACTNGACTVAACNPGFADCDKSAINGCEVDLRTDVANCGACGTGCMMLPNATGACKTGHCAIGMCNPGFADCDGLSANGCETAVSSDIRNCGACARLCTAPNGTPACMNGSCAIAACNPGFADCNMNVMDGCEASVSNDVLNCGGCGKVCPVPANATATCANSTCGIACKFGFADCNKNAADGCEASLLSTANCGSCGNACAAPANATAGCNNGACGIGMCNPLFGDCNNNAADGCEKSLAADTSNCGACGHLCSFANATAACLNGQCGIASCNAGFADCNMNPADGCEVNTRTDKNNCGACGKVCGAMTPTCTNGTCVAGCKAATGLRSIAGPIPLYGFCWYLGAKGVTCDVVCADLGAANLANAAANSFADSCMMPGPSDVSTAFFKNGNACGWTAAGSTTAYHTLGYGYSGSVYYGKCASGMSAGNGAFPGDTNNDVTRCLVCPCFTSN